MITRFAFDLAALHYGVIILVVIRAACASLGAALLENGVASITLHCTTPRPGVKLTFDALSPYLNNTTTGCVDVVYTICGGSRVTATLHGKVPTVGEAIYIVSVLPGCAVG